MDESSLMLSAHSSRAASVPVAAGQPVLIGVPSPIIYPQAGVNYRLPSWINGTSNQIVNWTLRAGIGSVTKAGVYSAPPSVTAPAPFTLQGLAQADPINPVIVSGFVIPFGTIRLDVGNANPYIDSHGNLWMADTIGVLAGSYMNHNGNVPASRWNHLADGVPYGWSKYTWGDDIQYGPFIVPNGAYRVTFLFAVEGTGTYSESRIYNNGLVTGGAVGLEANGAMALFSIGRAVHDSCTTPITPSIPVTVTDHVLRIALRATGGRTPTNPLSWTRSRLLRPLNSVTQRMVVS